MLGFWSGSGIDFSRFNPGDTIYIKGDASTDGSIRITCPAGDIAPEVQTRSTGLWKATGVSQTSVILGLDVSLAAIGSELQITSAEKGTKSIVLEVEFDDTGSRSACVPIVGTRLERIIFNTDDSTDIVTKHLEISASAPVAGYRHGTHVKTGSVAATKLVTLSIYKGVDATGQLVMQEVVPPEDWPANTEIEIPITSSINITVGSQLFIVYDSEEDFSLKGNAAMSEVWFGLDFQPVSYEDIVTLGSGSDRILTDDGDVLTEDGDVLWELAA